MKTKRSYCSAGLLAALLILSGSTMPAAADEDDDLIYLYDEKKDETVTYECGDFAYSRLVNADDKTKHAACIEHYTGSDTSLEIPTELDGLQVVALGDYAFSGAVTLEHVTIPETIISLGTYAFAECTMLQDFTVAADNPCFESVDGVLYGNEGRELMRYPIGTRPAEITVPEGVISIGSVAFCNCKLLETVTLPSTLEYIGAAAFSDCDRLMEMTIPEGVIELANFAFNSCASLKSVTLPESLLAIGDGTFAATALESVTIPESCQKIGQQAFAETKLTEVTIPKSVTQIDVAAFGWWLNSQNEMQPVEGFVIKGYAGSAAQTYAYDSDFGNNFEFVALDASEAGDDGASDRGATPAPVPEDEGGIGIGRIIGIALCCLMLAGIAAAAIFTGKKKKTAPKQTESEEASPNDAAPEKDESDEPDASEEAEDE